MFERFTDRARRAIVVAQEEAKTLHHDLIRPEHLLLGLAQGDGVAARALSQLGVSLEQLRATVEGAFDRAKADSRGSKVPFSPKAKKALELSLREALQRGHNYIGTEHLVLGALRVFDDDGAVRQLLGVDASEVRARVTELMTDGAGPDRQRSPAVADATRAARALAGAGMMTTGHLVLAILADTASLASRALGQFGVTIESLTPRLAEVPVSQTSDALPRPQTVEIKLGANTTTIGDPELAAALGDLSPEQLRVALHRALGADPGPSETGREQAS
jgi:ATP-dependent Clp protease ATP-binding subunit ClpC